MNDKNYYLTYFKPLTDLKSKLDSVVRICLYSPQDKDFLIKETSVPRTFFSYYLKETLEAEKSIKKLKDYLVEHLRKYWESTKDEYYHNVLLDVLSEKKFQLLKPVEGKWTKFILRIPNIIPKEVIEKQLSPYFQVYIPYTEYLRHYFDYPLSRINIVKDYQNKELLLINKPNIDEIKKGKKISVALNLEEKTAYIFDGKEINLIAMDKINNETIKVNTLEDLLKITSEFINQINPLFIFTYEMFPVYEELKKRNLINHIRFGVKYSPIKKISQTDLTSEYLNPGRIDLELSLIKNSFLRYVLDMPEFDKIDNKKDIDKIHTIYDYSTRVLDSLLELSRIYGDLPNRILIQGTKKNISSYWMKKMYKEKHNYPIKRPINEKAFIIKQDQVKQVSFSKFEPYEEFSKYISLNFLPGIFYGHFFAFHPLKNILGELINEPQLSRDFKRYEISKSLENIATYPLFLIFYNQKRFEKEFDRDEKYAKRVLKKIETKFKGLVNLINHYRDFYVSFLDPKHSLDEKDYIYFGRCFGINLGHQQFILGPKDVIFLGINLRGKSAFEKNLLKDFLRKLLIEKNPQESFRYIKNQYLDFKKDRIDKEQLSVKKIVNNNKIDEFIENYSLILDSFNLKKVDENFSEINLFFKKSELEKRIFSKESTLGMILQSMNIELTDEQFLNLNKTKSFSSNLEKFIKKSEKNLYLF
ncbi:MAG: hypothetical protein QW524_02360 [Candidatus Woesearchaeota archaeon]